MTKIKKFDLSSLNIVDEKKRELKKIFPEVIVEGDKIDFAKLKLTLGENLDVGKERFGLTWSGKADCFKVIQQPSIGTLIPDRKGSVNFDSTDNLFIEGDNLEVLKLLQKPFLGKVKMIYIDPPYNTGNDFIYPDDYSESLDTYLKFTGQVDSEGRRYSTNTEADGRFHSKWLSMMYPRLFLARNLLTEDGVIFISIDDMEVDNLRKICNEVFGEQNFIDCIVWKKRYGGGAKEKHLVTLHEYVLFYAKDIEAIENIFVAMGDDAIQRYYKLKDSNFEKRGPYRTHPLEATKSVGERSKLIYSITAPDGTKIVPERQWWWEEARVLKATEKNEIEFLRSKDGQWSVHTKQYLLDERGEQRQTKAFSIIESVYTQHGTKEIADLFGDSRIFSFPKPTALIKELMKLVEFSSGDMVLDFFAGSCATAQAVLETNWSAHAGLQFICVQLPEPTGEDSDASKAGFSTIAEIGKERIRRVIKRLEEKRKKGDALFSVDLGMRVFRLQASNFKIWDTSIPRDKKTVEKQLLLHIDHIDKSRTQEDILFELLLKSGFSPATTIQRLKLSGKTVFSISDGALLICLEKKLTSAVIKAIAEKHPSRVVCLDEGFQGNDQLKTNAAQIMKAKNVTMFRTI